MWLLMVKGLARRSGRTRSQGKVRELAESGKDDPLALESGRGRGKTQRRIGVVANQARSWGSGMLMLQG